MIAHNGHCPLNTILIKIISYGIQNQERDRAGVRCIGRLILYHWTTREPLQAFSDGERQIGRAHV